MADQDVTPDGVIAHPGHWRHTSAVNIDSFFHVTVAGGAQHPGQLRCAGTGVDAVDPGEIAPSHVFFAAGRLSSYYQIGTFASGPSSADRRILGSPRTIDSGGGRGGWMAWRRQLDVAQRIRLGGMAFRCCRRSVLRRIGRHCDRIGCALPRWSSGGCGAAHGDAIGGVDLVRAVGPGRDRRRRVSRAHARPA